MASPDFDIIDEAAAEALVAPGARRRRRSDATPPDVAARACALYQTGLSCREVSVALSADGLSVSHETVRVLAREAGVMRTNYRHEATREVEVCGGVLRLCGAHSDETVRRACRAYQRGMTTGDVVARYRIPIGTFEKWISKLGITRTPRRSALLRVGRRVEQMTGRDMSDLKVEAEQLYTGGLSSRVVAERLGLPNPMVYGWLRRRGVIRRRRSTIVHRFSAAEIAELRERALLHYQAGRNSREVGDLLGVRASTVGGWVRRAGLSRTRQGRKSPLVLRRERREANRLLGTGLRRTAIAREMHVSLAHVNNLLAASLNDD